MFNYGAIQTLLQEALNEDVNLRRSEDGEWFSLYDVFRKTGVANNTQAYRTLDKKFPSLTKNFHKVKFPGRGKHLSWALHKKHLQPLAGIFGFLAQKFPSPEVPETQPKPSSPVVQFAFVGMFSPTNFELPPVPVPLVLVEPDKKKKKEKTAIVSEISTVWVKAYKSIRKKTSPGTGAFYGWNQQGKRLLTHPAEILVVRELERLSCLGKTPKQLANLLDREKIYNRENKSWQEKEIKTILENSPRLWIRWARQNSLKH